MKKNYEAVVIGTSAGGLAALTQVLPKLPASFLPVIVVQHIQEDSENLMVSYLERLSAMAVQEAMSDEKIKSGNVYIAPPGYHLLIEHNRTFALSMEERVNFSRPSIDVLFESAALVYQKHLIGIILTGANSDGTRGLKMIHANGGLTIAQNPDFAEASTMPASAIESGVIDYILQLHQIAPFLCAMTTS